jgi:SAM-dependent methyltransferase
MSAEQVFLHVGCGPARKPDTTRAFAGPGWRELRLDIDPSVAPDIVGTMTDMRAVASESVDAVFSSHNIEHLYAHEVLTALGEFARVLRPDGFLVITCPDLQSVAAFIAADKLMEPAFMSAAGPIAPIDIVYGHRPQIAAGNHFMAHRCGFTRRVLDGALRAAGFNSVVSAARAAPFFDLWAVAMKRGGGEAELRALAEAHFPR